MNPDFSLLLYEKYFSLPERIIEIHMKSGYSVKCKIIGFYKGDEDTDQSYITCWHIIDVHESWKSGIGPLDEIKGNTIFQDEIASVRFLADNSTMVFN